MKAQPSELERSAAPGSAWSLKGNLFQDERLAGLGVRHGVTTVSLGDMKDAARRIAAFEEAGAKAEPSGFLRQVHGGSIVQADGPLGLGEAPQADGWLTRSGARTLAIFVADCMPIFMWNERGEAVGLFHAGWRGAAEQFPGRAARAFREVYGIEPARLKASIGPNIGPCCYKVGNDLARRFHPESVRRDGEQIFLDLAREAKEQLIEVGVPAAAIGIDSNCTACQPDLFYSYRRQKSDRRMMAFVCLK